MNILGIDYGRKKIGLAVGDYLSKLAEPYKVIKVENQEEMIEKVGKVVEVEKADKIILGITEGEMAKEQKEFGERLEKELGIEVIFQDETLSTKEAQVKSIEAGIQRKRRKGMEDAFAATLILQSYLDNL